MKSLKPPTPTAKKSRSATNSVHWLGIAKERRERVCFNNIRTYVCISGIFERVECVPRLLSSNVAFLKSLLIFE